MKKQNERLVIVISLILSASGLTLWLTSTFRENLLFFVTPTELALELKASGSAHPVTKRKPFRLGGLVEAETFIKKGPDYTFYVIDKQGGRQLVHYTGVPPDLFGINKGVVAEGSLVQGVFKAKKLLAKHDENYTAVKTAR